jgi:hypothetical protein
MMQTIETEESVAKEIDILQVPRQTYCDVLALMAGREPVPAVRRSPMESQALVEQLLDCWRILPSISASIFESSLQTILQPAEFLRLRNAWLAVSAFSKAQLVGFQPVIDEFERSGIFYSLLKGSAAGYRLYEQPFFRTSWDFDLGVSRRDIRAAEDLALQLGFRPAQKNFNKKRFEQADRTLRSAVETQHYELGFLVRRLEVTNLTDEALEAIRAVRAEPWTHHFWENVDSARPWCYSILDIHHAISLDIGLNELLSSTKTVSSGTSKARIPDDAWLAAHLIFKIYWEGVHSYAKGLYQFADLVRIVPFLDSDKFTSLIAILERYGMIAAGHYVCRRLPAFGVALPEHIKAFVQDTFIPPSGADPNRLNDLGDMWAKLWGQR